MHPHPLLGYFAQTTVKETNTKKSFRKVLNPHTLPIQPFQRSILIVEIATSRLNLPMGQFRENHL